MEWLYSNVFKDANIVIYFSKCLINAVRSLHVSVRGPHEDGATGGIVNYRSSILRYCRNPNNLAPSQ